MAATGNVAFPVQAYDIRLGLFKPFQQTLQASLNAVHVECRDLHAGFGRPIVSSACGP
jgi:hypothetical protein